LRDHPSDGAVFADDVILADHFAERRWTQTVGQRAWRIVGESASFEQIAHTRETSWSAVR
jgi:hypothetical protein